MTSALPTPFLFFIGAALLLLVPRHGIWRGVILLIVPLIALLRLATSELGNLTPYTMMGLELEAMRFDRLSRVFGIIFCIAAFLSNLYAWHVRDIIQQVAALLYAGSAIGAAFAGDFITLFFYWEGTAIASVFLIWARGTTGAYHTGMRYLIMQISSGVILLAGVALHFAETGSVMFETMTLGSLATWLIFIAFGIKCAFPLLHSWLTDAYPAATITGTVILSAFTTKLAVYVLARGFPGTELLIYVGATMVVWPMFYAVIENDLRRVLTYALNIQLGFMVIGVGIGTELALNGTAAHAFVGVLYKGLIFMALGAVMYRTGTAKATELGGLYRTMPLTMTFCLIGAASISAFPLFSGFISKSLIISDAAKEGYSIVWAIMVFGSAGVFYHTGIKIPYFAFFANDSGMRPKEAPTHMLIAMGITAFLCVAMGVYSPALYALLPFDAAYVPYTTSHVITQLQLLMFSALAFTIVMRTGIYPPKLRSINLESDVIYRRWLPLAIVNLAGAITMIWAKQTEFWSAKLSLIVRGLYHSHGPEGRIARVWPTGAMVLWIAVFLGATLIVNYVS